MKTKAISGYKNDEAEMDEVVEEDRGTDETDSPVVKFADFEKTAAKDVINTEMLGRQSLKSK